MVLPVPRPSFLTGVAVRAVHGLAVCAGAGGLELGIRVALGGGYRTVGYVERDAYAAACLVARMEDTSLEAAPVWDDVATFDGASWGGCVDVISAGFPCQPFSIAGLRRGVDDDRWIWPDIARVVGDVGPGVVFLENVTPLLGRPGQVAAVGTVLGDLAGLGFDAEWCVLGANEVGAPHRRRRVFILGWRPGTRLVADPDLHRRVERRVGHTGRVAERGPFPPRPGDVTRWRELAGSGVEPAVLRAADGMAGWVDRVRCVGNGVVPLVAAVAFLHLGRRAGILAGAPTGLDLG